MSSPALWKNTTEPRETTWLALALLFLVLLLRGVPARAHDIPNARVDRATQVVLEPGRLRVSYEVSLSELTLTRELRSLIGSLSGSDRQHWFETYGRETGPLNAKGFLVTVGDEPVTLQMVGFVLAVEEHPRYTFEFAAEVPARATLTVHDTNFASSEGTSRLAVRGVGVLVRGDDLPDDVGRIPARPVWQLSDAEERRTRQVRVDYEPAPSLTAAQSAEGDRAAVSIVDSSRPGNSASWLTRLLDDASRLPLALLGLIAFALGALHAVQPGHGKTLVATTVVSEGGGWVRGALLAVVTTLTHTGSVLVVAAILWGTESLRISATHVVLSRTAGFVIAAIGVWRLGRHLGGYSEHDGDPGREWAQHRRGRGRGLIGLGIAGGLVPCWDAVGLIILAEAIGRLGLGLWLVAAFSLGMGFVLVLIGWLADRFRRALIATKAGVSWERRLGLVSGLVLSLMGVYLLRN
jgi:nickel/cobalt exporter